MCESCLLLSWSDADSWSRQMVANEETIQPTSLSQRNSTHCLSKDVKMPIASSLHEISRILGPELSKEYMFTALDIILKDQSDAVKLAAIAHIS